MGSILFDSARHIRAQAKIDAARITQKSGNERRAAETALQQFSATLANQRALDAAGKHIDDTTMSIAHNLDAATYGTLGGRVRAAEELGSSVAMAAAAGVGGSSVDAYNSTLRLSHAVQEEEQQRAIGQDLYSASQYKGNILTGAIGSLDNNVYRANIDYTQYVDDHKMSTLSKLFYVGAAATATYFGGPQAGSAVLGFAESQQAAQNGDFGTANSALMGAVQNGFQAYKDTRSVGSYWSSHDASDGNETWGSVKAMSDNPTTGLTNYSFSFR